MVGRFGRACALFIVMFLALVACSHGGGGDGTPTPTPMPDADDDSFAGPDDDTHPPDDDSVSFDDDSAWYDDDSAWYDDDSGGGDDDTARRAADTDRDGVADEQEVLDGTDPLDPSDALVWHPELGPHPRLLTDAAGWQGVKDAILAGDPDAVRLFGAVTRTAALAIAPQEPGAYLFALDDQNARVAWHAALAAFVNDDPQLAAKAVSILAALHFDLSMITLAEWDHGTIHGGNALVNGSLAYDLLVGFDLIGVEEAAAIRAALLTYAATLYDMYITLPIGLTLQNNHLVRFVAGLGVLGINFNDIPEAARYVNLAMSAAPNILFEVQMPAGGGQGEGPNYFDYSLETFLPFAAIYHHFAAGEAYPVKTICRVRLEFGCTPEVRPVPDPMVDPRLAQTLDWRLAIVMPNGYAPPLDDSNLSCGYLGTVAAMWQRPDYTWLHRNAPSCAYRTSALAPLELVHLPFPDEAEPAGPAVFLPEAGQAVLRTGWEPTASYALLNGEHGIARLAGIGHEQADATSFLLYARGEWFAIDSGYIGFDDRLRVAGAEHHSLVLVDGKGPSLGLMYALADAPAYLDEFVDEPPFRAVRVTSRYRGARVERRLVSVGDDYFFTLDRVASNRPRAFTWQMHTNTGGTTDGELSLAADGTLLTRPNAVMRSWVDSVPGPPTIDAVEMEHGFSHGADDSHLVLRAATTGDAAVFAALSVPAADAASLPAVTVSRNGDTLTYVVTAATGRDVLLVGDGAAHTWYLGPGRSVTTDADLAWLRLDRAGRVIASHRLGGTFLVFPDTR